MIKINYKDLNQGFGEEKKGVGERKVISRRILIKKKSTINSQE